MIRKVSSTWPSLLPSSLQSNRLISLPAFLYRRSPWSIAKFLMRVGYFVNFQSTSSTWHNRVLPPKAPVKINNSVSRWPRQIKATRAMLMDKKIHLIHSSLSSSGQLAELSLDSYKYKWLSQAPYLGRSSFPERAAHLCRPAVQERHVMYFWGTSGWIVVLGSSFRVALRDAHFPKPEQKSM